MFWKRTRLVDVVAEVDWLDSHVCVVFLNSVDCSSGDDTGVLLWLCWMVGTVIMVDPKEEDVAVEQLWLLSVERKKL